MENKSTKAMAIAALLVGVVGLSIGFAAFANTLTINTQANVTPDNKLDVRFVENSFTCEHSAANNATTSTATVTAVGKNLNVVANMKHPGDKVTCTGTISNADTLDAYLNSVTGIADGTVAPNGTGVESPSVMPAASDITMTVKVGDDTYSKGVTSAQHTHKLVRNGSETVVVTITYGGSTYADGNFKVTFPTVSLNYSTVDNF